LRRDYLTIIKGISQSLNGPTNGGYDTKDSSPQSTMGEPLNRLDDASGASADEKNVKNETAV
jgi:hypothetical protein